MLELAVFTLAGSMLGHWFPWADASIGGAMALRLFLEARGLRRGTSVTGGGCGSGCGCG